MDSSYYKGEWLNGIQHGMGEMYVKGEGVKKGLFQNNVLVHVEEDEMNGINSGNVVNSNGKGNMNNKLNR